MDDRGSDPADGRPSAPRHLRRRGWEHRAERVVGTVFLTAFGVILAQNWAWILCFVAAAVLLLLAVPWRSIGVAAFVIAIAASLLPIFWPVVAGTCHIVSRQYRGPVLPTLGGRFTGSAMIESPGPGCVRKTQEFTLSLAGIEKGEVVWLVARTEDRYYPWPRCDLHLTAAGSAVARESETVATAEVQFGEDRAVAGQLFDVMILVTDSDGDALLQKLTESACRPWDGLSLAQLRLKGNAQLKGGITVVRRPSYWQGLWEMVRPPTVG